MPYQYPVVYQNNGHSPMLPTDQLQPATVPISPKAGNFLVARTDGLYSGNVPDQPFFYVNTGGTDAAGGGTKAAPFKTLDFALAQVGAIMRAGQTYTIAMQSGQTFAVSGSYMLPGNLVLTYYGDPIYGDFNDAQVTTAPNATMANLTRPIIAPTNYVATNGQNRIANVTAPLLSVVGATVMLPARVAGNPDPASYGPMDFYVMTTDIGAGTLSLFGAVIDTADALGISGIMSILSRTNVTLTEFATQFRVMGQQASAGVDATVLARRPNFIKFYSDVPGTGGTLPFLNPTALNSSNGSGILNLHWTDTSQQQIGATTNQGTFPILPDANFGLRQYITGVRKNGAIPINVICPRVGL